MRSLDFSSWSGLLSTVLGLAFITLPLAAYRNVFTQHPSATRLRTLATRR
jgi:hypothetical protein